MHDDQFVTPKTVTDQYGMVSHTRESANHIGAMLVYYDQPVLFAWSPNKVDAFIILIAAQFIKVGIMPFGGKPDGRAYVALYGIGAGHFDLKTTHPTYFEEKLSIDPENAKQFSQLWTWISEGYGQQRGAAQC